MRKLAPSALLIAALVVVPVLASARHVDVRDGNDTRGVLDIRRVDTGGSRTRPAWRISTFSKWTTKDTFDRGYLVVLLDSRAGTKVDYYALIRSTRRKLQGHLFKNRSRKNDVRISGLKVTRPNGRSARVVVPLNKLRRRDNGVYRWFAQTLYTSGSCRRVCLDRAPNRGRVTETNRPPEPSPTPTVPSPAPDPER